MNQLSWDVVFEIAKHLNLCDTLRLHRINTCFYAHLPALKVTVNYKHIARHSHVQQFVRVRMYERIHQSLFTFEHLTYLRIQRLINHKHIWPRRLKYLIIDNLVGRIQIPWPAQLKHLQIEQYKHNFPFAWPASLKILILPRFHDEMKYAWPTLLTDLKLGTLHARFTLPLSLQYLHVINSHYEFECFPLHLQVLRILQDGLPFVVPFPESLKELHLNKIERIVLPLPSCLEKLILICFDQPIRDPWPEHLTFIHLDHYNHELIFPWPTKLQYLCLIDYNHELNMSWPQSLKKISLWSYRRALNFPWPSNLQTLHLGAYYHQPFQFPWPSSLKSLILHNYNQPFHFNFPSSLRSIELHLYNQPFEFAWPSRLTSLHLYSYEHFFKFPFPMCLKELILTNYHKPLMLPTCTNYINSLP